MLRLTENFLCDLRSDLADRADVDDDNNVRDTLWSDEDLLRYLNSAAHRLASDTLYLRRRVVIPTLAGEPLYAFPMDSVIQFLSVGWRSPDFGRSTRRLDQFDIDGYITRDDYGVPLDMLPDLEATGTPGWFTRDWDNKFMRIHPIPQVAGVLEVQAIVYPDELYPGMSLPFQSRADYDLLLLWAKHLAYAKHDADVLDLDRSKAFERQYELDVRERCSEVDRQRRDTGLLKPR